ncbi:MAG: hypothetical protein Q8R44_15670, partial [Novosphingobium sp.]|nr:hypothetical protein [Novosphingobium sp.]
MIQELLALPDTVQHRRFAKAMQYQARLKISENEPFFQALRRALNRLHEPSIRSVGMINASWGGARWHLAANI